MLKRIGLTLALIAAMAATTAFAQAPTDVPPPASRTRINFLPGTSAYTLTTDLTQGVSQGYVLRVALGQSMFITKTGNASVEVLDPQDIVVIGPSEAAGPWGFQTTIAGDYTVVLYGQGYTTLTVYIPPLGASAQTPVPLPLYPQRIRFASRSTGYSFTADLAQGLPAAYILGISAGQQLYVSTQLNTTVDPNTQNSSLTTKQQLFLSPYGNVTVALLDPQGKVVTPMTPSIGSWQFGIPQTGDYTMVLLGSGSALISINIPPLGSSLSAPLTRISFEPGATSATVNGALAPNAIDRYVLRALAGQTMSINFIPSRPNVSLSISGADGTVLASGGALVNTWQGQLPSTQDYNIAVMSNSDTDATYSLQVTIPPLGQTGGMDEPRRISFAPGGTSASVQGTTATPGLDRFVIRALGGQTMTVSVSAAQGPVILIIYGADGNVLISDHAGATSWSGLLPTTQDYFVDTRSVGDAVVDFTLQVTIPPL
jgi:hypothetical protein